MLSPGVLTLSSATAAAQLTLACWSTQFFVALLRGRRPALVCHALLALLSMGSSTIAWRGGGLAATASQPWRAAWLISAFLAAIFLIITVSRWIRQSSPGLELPQATRPLVPVAIAVTGWLLTWLLLGQLHAVQVHSYWPRWALWCSLVSLAVMFGVTAATALELTLGETGRDLLGLPWSRLTLAAGIAFLAQIGLGMLVVAKLQPAESPVETMLPVLHSFGLVLLGYISWCLPRRMQTLACQSATAGQAALALAGWIGILCFCLAAALPAHWPWSVLK